MRLCRLAWLLIALTAAGCGGSPTPSPPARTPTDAPWALTAQVTPPTLQDYFRTARLDQTERIEFYDAQAKEDRMIYDPIVIQSVLQLLLNGPGPATPGTPAPVRQVTLVLDMQLGPRQRVVNVDYNPQQNTVQLDNIAMTYWPVQLQGTYPVAPAFGPALFRILQPQ